MSYLTSWLLSVIGTAFLVSLAEALTPQSRVREVAHLVGGILLLLALLSPLANARGATGDWSWSAADYSEQVAALKAAYQKEQVETLSKGIKAQSEAYIEAAAQELGLRVHAEVTLAEGEDEALRQSVGAVELPDTVTLDIPFDAGLSALIEENLGILPENQYWAAEETG
jgi:stage III sporulation protein AF